MGWSELQESWGRLLKAILEQCCKVVVIMLHTSCCNITGLSAPKSEVIVRFHRQSAQAVHDEIFKK